LTNPTTRSDTSQAINFAIVVSVIAEETDMSLNDLSDVALLADCGVDSLLSLAIVNRLQNAFETEVQHESIFVECQTVGDIKLILKRAINVDIEPVPASQQESLLVSNTVRHVARQEKTPSFPHLNQDDLASRRTAVEVLVAK
jgi:acyl carrier protein